MNPETELLQDILLQMKQVNESTKSIYKNVQFFFILTMLSITAGCILMFK